MSQKLVATLEQALVCTKCQSRATFVEEHSGSNFAPGEIFLISCPSSTCREKPWFFCKSCCNRCYQNSLARHALRKKHIDNNAIAFPHKAQQNNLSSDQAQEENPPCQYATNNANDNRMPEPNVNQGNNDPSAEVNTDMDVDPLPQRKEHEPMITGNNKSGTPPSYFPKLKMDGNERLAEAFKETKLATLDDVNAAFSSPDLEHMKNFYVSELASGEGRCGGGILYLCARAFQQVKDSQLDEKRYPDYEEAKWQINNFLQYHSMNEKQRQRQAHINHTLLSFSPQQTFFKNTFLPPYKQLGRYYGSSGQHSLYNNLPCPRAQDIDGVAYTRPLAIIAFLFANGIPIDDMVVTSNSPIYSGPDYERRVHNVDECQKAVDWVRAIQTDYYGSENGAPKSDSNFGAKHPAVVCLHLSDWTDGFDSGKVKSNRNAIDSKTLTISPPKHLANATDNTFCVALGLKKAKGWKKVEEMFRMEVEALTSSKEPILLYHGVLQKVIPCFFKRFAVLADKAERNGLTGTLGCGSDLHRCFGVSGKIQTPSCLLPELQSYLKKEQSQKKNRTRGNYGWCNKFINTTSNGAVYPACLGCRRDGLQKLLGLKDDTDMDTNPCEQCSNWDLLGACEGSNNVLQFPAHKDYPTFVANGCPVPAPKGRDIFQEGVHLPFRKLSWKEMKDGCKFAFYQASRPKYSWTKATTVCYLKHCGVSTKLADLLYDAARHSCKEKEQDAVDYNRPNLIGNFKFDPAWMSEEISVEDFIEAVMHQVFLGAAESNYELTTIWLSSMPSAAKLGSTPFLHHLQALIKDLRTFSLSWLQAYPLTGQKSKLGTGSWVAENWVFFVRVSQFIFGWCCKNDDASKYGVEDMSRMVIAFHAFVARSLTHGGLDGKGIDKVELYLKEFLSALREFDVRVRHEKLGKTTARAAEKKGTEAWWLKPNYMSLCNLVSMLRVLGPLVLWWDGGGRGERFIQVVKPHIKRGVRDDVLSFFVTLLEKLFRVRILSLFEGRFDLMEADDNTESEEGTVMEILNEIADILLPAAEEDEDDEEDESTTTGEENNEEMDSTSENEEEECTDDEAENEPTEAENKPTKDMSNDAYFSVNEAHGMTKTKAFYIYQNENQLNESLSSKKPIAGIVEVNTSAGGGTTFEFQVIFRKPVKLLARRKVVFNDNKGLTFHGMWCAPITVEEEDEEKVPATKDIKELQEVAKLSAVALPLWYLIGKNKPDSDKYCVITNWWKYRMKDGVYRLPSLDPSLYKSVKGDYNVDAFFKAASKAGTGGARFGII